jgi:hypothetical protein
MFVCVCVKCKLFGGLIEVINIKLQFVSLHKRGLFYVVYLASLTDSLKQP